MNVKGAAQVFDGVMLGDASIPLSRGMSPYFSISKSGREHLDYLHMVKEALLALGVPVSSQYPRVAPAVSMGRPYERAHLYSRVCSFTEAQRRRWYSYGLKVVPVNLILTPTVVACWFMDDGDSVWNSSYGQKTRGVSASFATYSFTLSDIERLEVGLAGLGVTYVTRTVDKRVRSGSGVRLRIRGESVALLMDLVEPFMVDSYRAKVKKSPGHIIERHRKSE